MDANRRSPLFVTMLAIAWLPACEPTLPSGSTPSAEPSAPSSDATSAVDASPPDAASYPQVQEPVTVTIIEPADGAVIDSAVVRVVAHVDAPGGGLSQWSAEVSPNAPAALPPPDEQGNAHVDIPMAFGAQRVTVRAYALDGSVVIRTLDIERPLTGDDNTPPELWINTPSDGFALPHPALVVSGRATDDLGVQDVVVTINGGEPIRATTQDLFATWSATVVPPTGPLEVRVTATDPVGRKAARVVRGLATFVGDASPPELSIDFPSDGAELDGTELEIRGRASDDSGIQSVQVRVGNDPYQLAQGGPDWSKWTQTISILPGQNTIRVRALDASGLTSFVELHVFETSGDTWGAPQTVTLRWAPPEHGESTFSLDRDGIEAIVPPSIAETLILLHLDPRPLIKSALKNIQNACGSGWWNANFDAKCPSQWSQREINLWRLITMTPQNANVEGTAIAGVAQMATLLSEIGLIDTFGELLAEALAIAPTDTFLATDAVAAGLVGKVLSTHPAVQSNGLIPVSLRDGLTDMATFGPRFDAAGGHPGFIDAAAGGTSAEVLQPNFALRLTAISNLHWHDGIVLGDGKGFIAFLADEIGPPYDDVLEFDFVSPQRFSVEGIAANPVVDLAFKVAEHDGWVSVGNSRYPLPRGNSDAWNLNPWTMESAIVEAAFQQYASHRAGCDWCDGADEGALLYEDPAFGVDQAEIVVGRHGYDKVGFGEADNFDYIDPNPPGWMRVWTLFGLGDPPAPQYVWDMILEVAQQRLLDGGVDEGDGDVLFRLKSVPVGLTGEAIKAAIRPVLEAQKSKLSDQLLGSYAEQGSPVDFYLWRGDDEQMYLRFAHPSDPLPSGLSTHAHLGFYADLELTERVSEVLAPATGDIIHEKLPVPSAGDSTLTVYCESRDGRRWQLEIGTWNSAKKDVSVQIREYLGVAP